MDLLKRLVGITTTQCTSFFSRAKLDLDTQEDFLSSWLVESCKIYSPTMGAYYNASDINWNAPNSKEHYDHPWVCTYPSNWAFYYPNNCSWVFGHERLTLDTLRKLDNVDISKIGRDEAGSLRLKKKIASYLLFQHEKPQVEEVGFKTVSRDVVEEDGQAMPTVYHVEYDEELSGLPKPVSDESVSQMKPYYAHPTKAKVDMTRSYSFIRKGDRAEECFKTVGHLVADDEEEVTMPVVYTVAYDEELSLPGQKKEAMTEVKENQRVVMKPKNPAEAKPVAKQEVKQEIKPEANKYVPKKYEVKEEWFQSVGVLVKNANEQEAEVLPVRYTVKYDEELIGVKA